MDQEKSSANESSFSGAEQYGQLLVQENFEAQAEDIFATIKQSVERGDPKSEAYKLAETYVRDEDNEQLKTLGKIILGAPLAVLNSQRLTKLQQQMKQEGPNREIKQSEKELKHTATLYNHLVRDLIFNNPDTFTRPQLENWLERGSGGNAIWAKQTVAGMAAEVAAVRVLQAVPGIAAVELSDIDQDLRGIDIVAVKATGRRVNIDIKYGGQRPVDNVISLDNREIIGINPEWIEGFSIKPDYQPELKTDLAEAISR